MQIKETFHDITEKREIKGKSIKNVAIYSCYNQKPGELTFGVFQHRDSLCIVYFDDVVDVVV